MSGEARLKYRVFIEETEYGSNLHYVYIKCWLYDIKCVK